MNTGVSSWERKRSPKPLNGVRLLALLLIADVAEQQGGGFVNRSMLVQIQSSALDSCLFITPQSTSNVENRV